MNSDTPAGRSSPSVWLFGATHGAGVSTLERFLSFTADCEGWWPPGDNRERVSPFVVVVARDSFKSLTAAHNLALAHREGVTGSGAELIGLITVAAAPTLDRSIRQHRDVVSAAFERSWQIGWHRTLLSASLDRLPRWHPLQDRATAPTPGVPAEIQSVGIALTNIVHARIPGMFADAGAA